jgi:hypothetical protein
MVTANCYLSPKAKVAMSPRGNLLSQINIYLDEATSDEISVGDIISDSEYNEQSVFSIAAKYSSQNYVLIVEDLRKTLKSPEEGRGVVFTPTPNWKLARVGTATVPDQFRALYDETNREIIDENLGGVRENVLPHTITTDDMSQGFVDISTLSPEILDAKLVRVNVLGGIEQLNADNMLNVWGTYPDFQVQLSSTIKRIVFQNYGQPTVPLTGNIVEGDTIQIIYPYKV